MLADLLYSHKSHPKNAVNQTNRLAGVNSKLSTVLNTSNFLSGNR